MAFRTSRTFTVRGRPPRLAGGISEPTSAHSASVKSLSYLRPRRSAAARCSGFHMRHLSPTQVPHKESQPIRPTQLLSGRGLRALPRSSDFRSVAWAETAQHQADHGEADEHGRLASVTLVIAGEPTTTADPCEGAFDDPSFRQDNEAVLVAAAHDLQFPDARARDDGRHLAPLIARVADEALNEREAASCLPQQSLCTVSILDACRMHADGQQQAERIGQDVALAAKHLLASVIAGRVERSPPLTAPFAVWLSMIAVVGLASRPACSRTSTVRGRPPRLAGGISEPTSAHSASVKSLSYLRPRRSAAARCSGFHMRHLSPTQVPHKESQPIRPTQLLSGSALRSAFSAASRRNSGSDAAAENPDRAVSEGWEFQVALPSSRHLEV